MGIGWIKRFANRGSRTSGRRMARASRSIARIVEVDVVDGDGGRTVTRRQITADDLAPLRVDATALARTAGLSEDRAARFALAVSEAAANTVVHAAGTGEVTLMWDGQRTVYARITDRGPGIQADPLDRHPPSAAAGGRGLWLTRQLTDNFRVDSGPAGTTVHLEMTARPAGADPDAPGNTA